MLERCGTVAILLLGLLSISPAHAEPIDLKQAQRIAIERNLQLRAETFTTRASDAGAASTPPASTLAPISRTVITGRRISKGRSALRTSCRARHNP